MKIDYFLNKIYKKSNLIIYKAHFQIDIINEKRKRKIEFSQKVSHPFQNIETISFFNI